jgi:hypothetical protein
MGGDPAQAQPLRESLLGRVLDAGAGIGADSTPASADVPVAPRPLPMAASVEALRESARRKGPSLVWGLLPRDAGDVTCPNTDGSCSCASSATRIGIARAASLYRQGPYNVAWSEPNDIELTFASGEAPSGPVILRRPRSHSLREDTPGPSVGEAVLVCRGAEAALAWSVSSWVNDHDVHEIHRARCTQSGCVEATTVVTRLSSELTATGGSKRPDFVNPPFVADLGPSIALVWRSHPSYFARVAPIESLDVAETRVLDPNTDANDWLDDLLARDGELRLLITARDPANRLTSALVFAIRADGRMTLDGG